MHMFIMSLMNLHSNRICKQEAHAPQSSPELTAISLSGHLLIIPYQPVNFNANGLNRYLAYKVKMLKFSKDHNSKNKKK